MSKRKFMEYTHGNLTWIPKTISFQIWQCCLCERFLWSKKGTKQQEIPRIKIGSSKTRASSKTSRSSQENRPVFGEVEQNFIPHGTGYRLVFDFLHLIKNPLAPCLLHSFGLSHSDGFLKIKWLVEGFPTPLGYF